jgi:hypothetical protein
VQSPCNPPDEDYTKIFCINSLLSWSQNYFTTGSLPPSSSSWRQAPWDQRPVVFFSNRTLAVIVLSDERMGLLFTIVAGLASTVILRSKSCWTHDYILLSHIWDPPTWRVRSPHLYSPGTGWPGYNPTQWVSFTLPPTTRRATVEVFDPASTQLSLYSLSMDNTENSFQQFCCCMSVCCGHYLAMTVVYRAIT